MNASQKKFRSEAGLSLIELMIAMALGLITIAAVGYVYLGTSRTYRTEDALARMQEGARYAFEVISNDLRMAGTAGCTYQTSVNVLNNYSTTWYENLLELPLSAKEKDGAGLTQYSDALYILRADVSRDIVVQNHDGAAGTFTTKAAHGLSDGALLLATDCSHVAVFQAKTASASTITYAAGGTPGNSTANLGAGGTNISYTSYSRLYPLVADAYHVAMNPTGQPSLYRSRPIGSSATVTGEELVEGVEDFQVTFGVDTDATANGSADLADPTNPYLTADKVNSALVPGASAQDRWARVVSIRISLLMRTVEDNVSQEKQTYTYNGKTIAATDRRLRKVFTHVIKVRNR